LRPSAPQTGFSATSTELAEKRDFLGISGFRIVADSVPEREDEECRNKAAVVVRAIGRARSS
jgi:anthranilate/para-aminobenzoate synthase component I